MENARSEGASSRVIKEDELRRMMRKSNNFFSRNEFQLATLALVAINVVLYLVEVVLSGFRTSITTETLINMGAMLPLYVSGPADLWRFVAPMFLHMDFMHLLFNMVALYSVGLTLERILGKGGFVALYFIGGITGNLVSYLWGLLFEGGMTVSAGASTSVFGLFAAVALLGVLGRGNRKYLVAYSKGILAVIVINVVYSILMPGISLSGHLGGALGGAIGMLMMPSKNLRTPVALRILAGLVWLCVVVGGIYWGMTQGIQIAFQSLVV